MTLAVMMFRRVDRQYFPQPERTARPTRRELRSMQQNAGNVGLLPRPDENTALFNRGARRAPFAQAPAAPEGVTVCVTGAMLAPAPAAAATGLVAKVDESPVFVDDSGSRKRLLRIVGVLLGLLSISFLGVVGVALAVPSVATSVGLGDAVPFVVPGAAAAPPAKAPVAPQVQPKPKPRPKPAAVATPKPKPVAEAPAPKPAPVEQAPVTQAPVTEAPVTEAPVTEAPVTEAPVTEAPAPGGEGQTGQTGSQTGQTGQTGGQTGQTDQTGGQTGPQTAAGSNPQAAVANTAGQQ
jgi:outer membrane biosynthesis protein TonB